MHYEKLQQIDEDQVSDIGSFGPQGFAEPRRSFRHRILLGFVAVLLILSNALTWSIAKANYAPERKSDQDVTPFAKLSRDVPIAFEESNVYVSANKTEALQAWSRINIDAGMVALPASISEAHALPNAQRFVWDQSKGTYLINGYHSLHCIRSVYISLMEFYYGVEQSRSFWHVIHCVDSLRQEVICDADDTPRYSTETQRPESGMNQIRMCRSWDKLESWAKQYSSCYAFVNQTAAIPEIQRFLYCDEDSPYREKVLEVFGQVPTYQELDLEVWSYRESFDVIIEAQKEREAMELKA